MFIVRCVLFCRVVVMDVARSSLCGVYCSLCLLCVVFVVCLWFVGCRVRCLLFC